MRRETANVRKSIPPILLLAITYAGMGWLALQVAVPPYMVSQFFPSAGIALAALLIFGPRLWPGVFLGSALVQAFAGSEIHAYSAWVFLMVPLGATLQALFGYWLAQRLIGFPNALNTPRTIALFLGVVAPLGTLVGMGISTPTLAMLGLISHEDLLFSAWNWWLGDTLGVLIAAPLMFVFFAQPRMQWRSRAWPVALPMLAAAVLTAWAFTEVRKGEHDRVATQFAREAGNHALLVDKRLDAQLYMLLSLERHLAHDPEISREAFAKFVQPMLELHPGTQNFSWNPLVRAGERESFERRVREDWPEFVIMDRLLGDFERTGIAAPAEIYFPILFVEPLATNRSVVGLTPYSIPPSRAAIRQTLETGKPVASESFLLTQERANQRGVVVYQVVRAENGSPLGLVTSAFRMDDLMHAVAGEHVLEDMAICLVDAHAAPSNQRLFGPSGCDARAGGHPSLVHLSVIPFAERQWLLEIRANPEFVRGQRHWGSYWTMLVGMLASGVLGAFLLITSGHAHRTQALVRERTAQLAETAATLEERQRTLARAQRIANMGSLELNPRNHRVVCSDQMRDLIPLPDSPKFDLSDLLAPIVPNDRKELTAAIERISAAPGTASLDCELETSESARTAENGSGRMLRFSLQGAWDSTGLLRIEGIAQDVSHIRAAERQIRRLAHFDPLTGLPNRYLWRMRAQSAFTAAQRRRGTLAVLFLDLDRFKTVNDSLGHNLGDQLLFAVADRLKTCLGEEDILARWGGDEFVALLPRLEDPADAGWIATNMLRALSHPVVVGEYRLSISVSIGIALHPQDGQDVDTLLQHADTAMYGAKDSGRNNFRFFVASMNERVRERLAMEGALRQALDHGGFELHYQPQWHYDGPRLIGAEALLRLRGTDGALIQPGRFIHVAEESGLIIPIGEWVLETACRQQVCWHRAGYSQLMVAVNVSALQFQRDDFVDRVKETLAHTRADPRCLELEITESALLDASAATIDKLDALAGIGISLALDDFGTGYSSLAYLKRLPLHRIKLDHSFVRDLPDDPEDAAIISAAISMARNLGLDVIAEGVETLEQQDFLVAMGCQRMQGFLFARPLPVDMFEREHPPSDAPGSGAPTRGS